MGSGINKHEILLRKCNYVGCNEAIPDVGWSWGEYPRFLLEMEISRKAVGEIKGN